MNPFNLLEHQRNYFINPSSFLKAAKYAAFFFNSLHIIMLVDVLFNFTPFVSLCGNNLKNHHNGKFRANRKNQDKDDPGSETANKAIF
jgi:hypothetical protein